MLRTWNKDRSDDRATRKTPQMRHGESKMTNGKWFPEDVVTMEYPPVLGRVLRLLRLFETVF